MNKSYTKGQTKGKVKLTHFKYKTEGKSKKFVFLLGFSTKIRISKGSQIVGCAFQGDYKMVHRIRGVLN